MATEENKTAANTEKEENLKIENNSIDLDLDIQNPEEEELEGSFDIDLGELDKKGLSELLGKELTNLQSTGSNADAIRKTDRLARDIRPVLDQIKKSEFEEARQKYITDNGNEEGFEFRYDNDIQKIEESLKAIRDIRQNFYQKLEKNKEDNFNIKTSLLQQLRELIEKEEGRETGASDMKSAWDNFKKIQEQWKSAGNVSSPHNGTLWATYNALVDRYFSIRNIYFELKELDRKKNAELKAELCEKIETLAASVKEQSELAGEVLDEATQIFEEYKHIGPAPKEDQEALWQRFKAAMDVLYDARRAQREEQKKSMSEVYEQKSRIYEDVIAFTTFNSGSINEWNAKTKELLTFQEAWIELKGPMPREEGKDLSKKFWAALKTFFHNKGEFFRQLEKKRQINLTAKTELCDEVEKILESGEDSHQNTQKIIEIQKKWKQIGQVPEKFKNSIYDRFKAACDRYFEKKRTKNSEQDKEFEANLTAKTALCDTIEKAAETAKDATLEQLNRFKEEWSSIGFVPKKDMQNIQKRYIHAINSYVSAIGKLSNKEKEQVLIDSEVELAREGDSERGLLRKESDIRRKITSLENDIAVWKNNIEFFAKSKTSDKLKATFEKKIETAQNQLEELKHQLNIIQEAI